MFSYKPLLKQLIDKDIPKKKLKEDLKITSNTMSRISKNEYISMAILDNICNYLHCDINKVVEHIEDDAEE